MNVPFLVSGPKRALIKPMFGAGALVALELDPLGPGAGIGAWLSDTVPAAELDDRGAELYIVPWYVGAEGGGGCRHPLSMDELVYAAAADCAAAAAADPLAPIPLPVTEPETEPEPEPEPITGLTLVLALGPAAAEAAEEAESRWNESRKLSKVDCSLADSSDDMMPAVRADWLAGTLAGPLTLFAWPLRCPLFHSLRISATLVSVLVSDFTFPRAHESEGASRRFTDKPIAA